MKILINTAGILLFFVGTVGLLRAQDDPTQMIGRNNFAGYSINDIDTVSTINGNVTWHIPLYSLKQKGNLPLTFSISGNSLNLVRTQTCQPGSLGEGDSFDPCGDQTYSIGFGVQCAGGIGFVSDQDFGLCRTAHLENAYDANDPGQPRVTGTSMFRSWSGVRGNTDTFPLFQDYNDPTKLRSTDGSGLMVSSSAALFNDQNDIPDPQGVTTPYDLYDKTGTVSHFTSVPYGSGNGAGNAILETQRVDSNGNSIQRGHVGSDPARFYYQDSLGRVFVDGPLDLAYSAVTLRGIGNTTGCPSTAASYQPAYYSYTWTVPGPNGSISYLFCYASVLVRTGEYNNPPGTCEVNASETGYEEDCDLNASMDVLQSVTLPNGTSWKFEYDAANPNDPNSVSYGTLTKLITPQGGSISYTYAGYGEPFPPWGGLGVATRTVEGGLGHSTTWEYHIAETINVSGSNAATQTTRVVAPLGVGETVPNETVYVFGTPDNIGGFNPSVEIERKTYQGSATSGLLLEDVNRTYRTTSVPATFLNLPRYASLLPSEVSTTHQGYTGSVDYLAYDAGFTAMQTECYRSNATINPQYTCGMYTDYRGIGTSQVSLGLPKNVHYTNYSGYPNKGELTAFYWEDHTAYFGANLLGAPETVTVADDSGFNTATTYGYDDDSNGSPQGTHGNVTTVARTGTNGGSVSTSAVYDSAGRVIKSVDGRNNETDYHYDDAASGEVTRINRPTTNGTAHTSYYSYDASAGLLHSYTDENGAAAADPAHTTTYSYDAMERLVQVAYPPVPVGSSTTLASPTTQYCYTDLGGSLCPQAAAPPFQMYTSTTATPDPSVLTMKQFDGLGRGIKSVLLSDPGGPQITDTTYDAIGRTATISSAYRTKDDPTYDLIIYGYDALGRKLSASHSGDGSSTTWSYSGPNTTLTDEIGNPTTIKTDALGRTVAVTDPTSMVTNYSYDVMGNLTGVSQPGNSGAGEVARIRSFTYDSLSRLVCAANPETTVVGVSCPASVASGLPSGALTYSYDSNGNVLTKTNANGVVQTNTYDALNRLISSIYSNDSARTPSFCYAYDGANTANMVGRLAADWVMPYGGSCAASPPTSAITAKSVLSYDAIGNALVTQQCVLSMCSNSTPFRLTQSFDLAGNQIRVTQTGIPSAVPQLQLSSNYDGAGRLSGMQSSWDGTPNSTDPLNIFSVQSYSPAGLQNWTLGNFLNFQKTYDSRFRPTSEVVTHP